MKTPLYILLTTICATSLLGKVDIPESQSPASTEDSPIMTLQDGKVADLPAWIEDIYINYHSLIIVGTEESFPPEFKNFTVSCYNRYGMLLGTTELVRFRENGSTYWNAKAHLHRFPLDAIFKFSALSENDDLSAIAWMQINKVAAERTRVLRARTEAVKAE